MTEKKDPSKSPRETNGPVVRTGPTSGQNRSRNADGEWRKKRSDAGTTKKKSGCFLTSAACLYMGREDDCEELRVLRAFRDEYLMTSASGRALVHEYYDIAPAIASQLSERDLAYVWRRVSVCIDLILARRMDVALDEYKSMVQTLQANISQSLLQEH